MEGEAAKAFGIADNRTAETSEWQWDEYLIQLAELEGTQYSDSLGLTDKELSDLLSGGIPDEDGAGAGSGSGSAGSSAGYTQKIAAPIYEPKNEKPAIADLVDAGKTDELIAEILGSDVSDEEKQFLIKAAQRHSVFNYSKIADFYANSDSKVQELMEKSALVLIDFDKALEYGYVKLKEEIANQYLQDFKEGEDGDDEE